ncbi:uncharacterized protein LOC130782062 [Actinidia eriantha]|uniref:uncharacterized protein LOC130782062 n=1 Tax=Actinidia eriantha TaxID=165200 RepID=UPI00258BC78C|nr:uncharacterized protein LOC130782062 [Actinidia eriantha]
MAGNSQAPDLEGLHHEMPGIAKQFRIMNENNACLIQHLTLNNPPPPVAPIPPEVSPRRGLKRFGRGGKLSPRYIGPFDIIAKIGEVAYRLALPPQLSGVHDVFHELMLRKYEPNPSHVLEWRDLELETDASYIKRPIRILDTLEHVLKGRSIPMVKVLWTHHGNDEATWEKEDEIRAKYPELFRS